MFTRLILVGLLYCTFSAEAAVLFPLNSTWRFFRGTNEASLPDTTAWRSPTFNDANFANAPAPFWFGDVRPGGTELVDMRSFYNCIFLRRSVVVSNIAEIGAIKVNFFIDDGFIIWVNGIEAHREAMPPGEVNRMSVAANQPLDPAPLTSVTLSPVSGFLQEGTNWVTIQAFNTLITSSDFGFDCSFETITTETNPPTIAVINPAPGNRTNLNQVAVTFSEQVTGVNADDLLINTQPATSVSGSGSTYTFTFPQPLYGNVSMTWFSGHGITDTSFSLNPFDATALGATWQYTLVDAFPPTVTRLFPAPGVTLVALGQVEITFNEEVTGVNAADLLINSVPATNVIRLPGGPYIFKFAPVPTGLTQLQWADGHGITDQAFGAPNAFAGGSWSYTVDPNAPPADVIINEINTSNLSGLRDEDGQEEDWIELYNRGAAPVDLGGWSLSDDPEIDSLWILPSQILAPGEYLVIFASGKDRENTTGTNKLHTNFQLSNVGELLGLYSPDSPRHFVSGFSQGYPEQRNDNSYGYDSGGNLRYFATPTPGGPNGDSTVVGVCESVHFSVARGHFTQPFNLILSTATPGGSIRYTTDGSEPRPTSTLYIGSLRISNTTLIRASAFKPNFLPSRSETHTYFFNQSAAIRSLPIVSLATSSTNLYGRTGILGMQGGSRSGDGAFITNNPATDYHNPSAHGIAWERPVSVEYIRPEDNSGFQIDAGLRVQGSDWQRPRTTLTSKFSFRVYFRSDYGAGRLNYPLFPLSPVQDFDQVVLRAGFNETGNPFIRDEITRRLSHDMGEVASHGTFFNLFTNGVYVGYYNPCERVHEEMMQGHLGGGDAWDVVGPSFALSSEGLGIVDGDRNDFNNMVNYVWVSQTASTITNPAIYTEVARRLDLTAFADYCLLNAYVAMGDWPANNWRAARERRPNAQWKFIAWDAEWAMGIYALPVTRDSFGFAGTGTEDAGLNSTGNSEIARLYQRLRASPEFRLLCADRIQKHFFNGGALTGLNITNRFNEMRVELSGVIPSMDIEILDWARDRHPIIMGQFNTYGLFGLSNALYGSFASSNAPSFNQHGGRVAPGFGLTMTAPLGGTIYYTTNGTDPRVKFNSTPSPQALAYSGSVVLGQSGLVKARTLLNGTNWSALNEATFDIGTRGVPLRITEIMYNPAGGSLYEFVELQNVSGSPIDMTGINFDEGINFTFTSGSTLGAGARVVLASNTDTNAWATRYPGVTVGGYFSGNLDNGGERLTLRDSDDRIILSVDYDDGSGWPLAADGNGSSLEIIDSTGAPDAAANWRASIQFGGTPGLASTPPPPSNVRLNEIMAENLGATTNAGTFPDWIELHNSGSALDLAGWSLSDGGDPRKFVFPANSTIGAGGYLVIWCDAVTNTTPGLHAGFALQGSGDEVFLYDPNTNRVDAVSFGLQVGNLTVGRIANAWQLNQPTPGAANSAAALAATPSLSINEWIANPLSGQPDWIELYNTAALPVPLQGIYLATTTVVHQVSSLAFLPAHGFIQLFADEAVGPDHLDFKLAAAGGAIILYDPIGAELSRVTYTSALEGLSRGRLPDGSATLVNFPGSASPGAANYTNAYTGALINEVLARNQTAVTNGGRVADYVELYNPAATSFQLDGMSLSVGSIVAGQWTFPVGSVLPASSYLVVWCDAGRPASSTVGDYNTGRDLDGESGGVYLFNAAGQMVNSVDYGSQVPNLPIGLINNQWRLFAAATPGATNGGVAALGTTAGLRINEWMANPASGTDWFELYNPTNRPVDLSGLFLTDDASSAGVTNYRVVPLSFIAAKGFATWVADANPAAGANHVDFQLDGSGELLRVYAGSSLIDTITFGPQAVGVSQGRLLDGSDNIVSFAGSPSPRESNYLPLENALVNEVLAHSAVPLEDAIELHNPTAQAVNISGWLLSNSRENFRAFRIPDGTMLPGHGYFVFYQNQFGNNGTNSFSLSSAVDNEVWLSATDASGALTGNRSSARFGPSANGVSFGRVVTGTGIDYAPLSARTFGSDTPASVAQFRTGLGLANAAPLVGPVVINEVMYHPTEGSDGEEYVELHNTSGVVVPLFDVALPANHWRLSGGVEFTFPANISLAPGSYALVVDFDPANASALTAFRNRYGLAPQVAVYGPFSGQLDNAGETLELLRPDAPGGEEGAPGFVPYLVVDRLSYADAIPWPSGGADGGGLSLQRRSGASYGNDPINWLASPPTAGAANGGGIVVPPSITQSPQNQSAPEDATAVFNVASSGPGPLSYQWRLNGINIPNATAATLAIPFVQLENAGNYDVVVANAGGAALSSAASLEVMVPISILVAPTSYNVRPGTNVSFGVTVRGPAPLTYQWRHNGINVPGANSPTLSLANVQLADDGAYDVVVSNPREAVVASAQLGILIDPVIVVGPIPTLTVVMGGSITVSVEVTGNPAPFRYEWRRGSVTNYVDVSNNRRSFYTITGETNTSAGGQVYRVVVQNPALSNIVVNRSFRVQALIDTDGDLIPDIAEAAYGGGTNNPADANLDPDGDGMSNREEYEAGTDPTNNLSYLRVDHNIVPGSASLNFLAVSNRTYSLQYKDALNSALWLKIGDALGLTNNRVETIVDPSWTSNRFYRLVTPSQP